MATSSTLWSLLFKIEADNVEMRRALDDADRRIAAFEQGINRSSRNVGAGFAQMSRGAGQVATGIDKLATRAALLAAGGLAMVVKAAVDFEDAFAGVRKTVDATAPELAQLRGELRQMAREMPLSHADLARVAEQAGALGIASENIAEFTRVAALIGVTTDVSSDQAATSLGVLTNILNLRREDLERFGSTLVDLGNKGASTESQILGIAERAGAGAALIDMNAAATLGWSAAVANLGIEMEAGGSSLQRFFLMSLEHVAKGGEELAIYADLAGMAKDEFAELFGRDSSEALRRFIAGMGELEEAERLAVLEALGFNDIRITRALLGLSGNVDNLTDSLSIANQAWAENSALGVEAEKRFGTTASQLQILRNNILDAAITIGDNLLPVLNELVHSGVAWLIEHEADIDQFGQDLAVGIRNVVEELKGADFSVLIEGMKTAGAIAKGAFDLFRGLPPEVQQLAIAALIANKVTGGAIFDIARGLANIFGGALRTIYAGHVTVIGGTGGGGPPGGSLGGLGGLLGGLGRLLAGPVGGALGPAALLAVHGPEQLERNQADPVSTGALYEVARSLFDDNGNLLEAVSSAEIEAASGMARQVEVMNNIFNSQATKEQAQLAYWALEQQLGALQNQRLTLEAEGTATRGLLAAALANQQAGRAETVDGFTKTVGNVSGLKAVVEEGLPDTAVMEGAALTQTAQLPSIAAGIADGSLHWANIDSGIGALDATLRAKNFNPNINVWLNRRLIDSAYTNTPGFAEGAWDLPATGLAMLHQGEMVVPRFDAQAFRELAGSGGGGDNMTVNINAPTLPMSTTDIGMQLRRIQRLRAH